MTVGFCSYPWTSELELAPGIPHRGIPTADAYRDSSFHQSQYDRLCVAKLEMCFPEGIANSAIQLD